MSSEEQKASDTIWWDKKKKPIIANLDKEIELRKQTLGEMTNVQQATNIIVTSLTEDISKLHQIENIYKDERAYLRNNPVTEGSIDYFMNLTKSDVDIQLRLSSNAQAIKTNVDSMLGTIKASGSMVASMATTTVHLANLMADNETILPNIESINKPTAQDRRKDLSAKLSAINGELSTKLNGAWETLLDYSKNDRFSQGAHSAREIISDLLHILAPDGQVKAMEWFVPDPNTNGNPTHRQRARFAILGKNNALSDPELDPIYNLEDSIRDSYKKLNRIAHLRDYETDLQSYTESLVDQCQIYILKLLELRSAYFKYE